MQIQKITFSINKENRCQCGTLVALEEKKEIPFSLKRVFYIYDVGSKSIKRGAHAHKHSNQILICLHGSCEVILDDGREKSHILLNTPSMGIVQERLIWGEMHRFSKDAILMVLSDSYYDPNEYIHDYEEFLQLAKELA